MTRAVSRRLQTAQKVYKPHDVISAGQEYVVTDNYTAPNGRVYNRQEQNAGWARKWVDENEK